MNAKIIIILLTAVLLTFGFGQVSAQTCATAPIGLVSAYSGDGNALDARSRNNGTIQGNVTFAAGKVGQTFQLAGNGDLSGSGDRVIVGNPANLRLQDFTIESWVKRSSATILTNSPFPSSPNGTIFAYGQNGYAFFIDQNTNRLGLTNVGISLVSSNLSITDTNWHHVAVTKSGNQVIFYVDGAADTPVIYNTAFVFTTNAAIGARGDSNAQNAFFGAIDELSIYNRELSAAEINSIYNSGTAGKCKPLATYAPDNQVLWLAGDGDAKDSSGNGNNGTLSNGAGFGVGKVGQSLTFDGLSDLASVPHNQITVPHNENQNVGNQLTIEGWIKPATNNNSCSLLQKRTNSNVGGYVLEVVNSQTIGFYIFVGGTFHALIPANSVTAGVWQHIAATYDGAFMRIYVNGIEIANQAQTGAIDSVTAPIIIGRNIVVNSPYQGGIDELGLYNRALAAAEIQSISNAGLAGKYKVQSTVPANIAAWYPGDGNANDLQAANNGTLQGGATYAAGKVGQAFSLNGTNAFVLIPNSAANDPTTAGSIEAWVKFNQTPSAVNRIMEVIGKGSTGTDFDLQAEPDNRFRFYIGGGNFVSSNTVIEANVWYHVAGTWDSTVGLKMYVNGVLENTNNTLTTRGQSGQPLKIGSLANSGSRLFSGLIDEPGIYNRMLTTVEINSIYNAQSGGKFKGAANPAVSNKTKTGDVELTFANLTAAGAVHEVPVDQTKLPALPVNSTSTGLYYDVAANAAFTGNVTECFSLPLTGNAFDTAANFNNLKVLHLEAGAWQDRTLSADYATRTLCGRTTTLSPFAIVLNYQPTAAAISIAGKVTANGRGLANARVELTGTNGKPVIVTTNLFGVFTFREVEAGATYIVNVSAKRYSFAPQIVSATENVSGLRFDAIQ